MKSSAMRISDQTGTEHIPGRPDLCRILKPNDQDRVPVQLEKDWVHFLFARDSDTLFEFSPHYNRNLRSGNYFLLYDQNRDLSLTLRTTDPVLCICMHPEILHAWLLNDYENMPHRNFNGFGVKEYSEHPISPEADIVVGELLSERIPTSLSKLFINAKVRELMSYCYDVPEEQRYENCPFLKDQENVERIKTARKILLDNMANPPTLSELSKAIGMNEYNLKVGFKNVYGLPAFKYLQQYRLEHARRLLRSGLYQVNEISEEVGYTTSSHFIEAFRKRYGITPKQFQLENA
ncbi:MAG: helix-turn-helix transcriptional regulator [Flavobacteriales bacterium]|nr:helix-turn-helix transcriptional regulator [Flavobacteriales bacterium]